MSACTLLALAAPSWADVPRDLTALLEPIRKQADLPAMWAAATSGNGLIAIGVTGVRRRGDTEAAQADDLLHLGSCTKAMTADLCAILVTEGTLTWDQSLAASFPAQAGAMHEGFRGVTLAQLCTNSGGLPGEPPLELWRELWEHRGSPMQARQTLLERSTAIAPAYPPGTRFEYSNFNFVIAGHVAESAARQPYEDLIIEKLFKPLGITSVGFGAPGTPGKLDQPRGHHAAGEAEEPTPDGKGADNPAVVTPAGRVHMSISDWAKYAAFHLRGARGEPQKLGPVTLDAEVFKKLHTPPDKLSDYAFGWETGERSWAGPPKDRRILTHAGSNSMWLAVVWIAPGLDRAFLVVTNQGGPKVDKALDDAIDAMIKELK